MKFLIGFVFTCILALTFLAQNELNVKIQQIDSLRIKEKELLIEIEQLKLAQGIFNLKNAGYPVSQKSPEIKEYKGFVLGFDCEYKMAAWTFHILSPDSIFERNKRTNNFNMDNSISCGTAKETDYFLKTENEDNKVKYKSMGFDRGHLVPSADLCWSLEAMRETYYYSNITPQRPEFNQKSWASLESLVRTIVDEENNPLYILTGPVLNRALEVNYESENKIKIPNFHYKIIVDLSMDHPRGMAFLMPNKKCDLPPSNYVVSIDSIERLTGLDFFSLINDTLELKIESKSDFFAWKIKSSNHNVEPLNPVELPKGYFNTDQAASKVGSTVSIVGKVVSTKFIPQSQKTYLNLDREFPNQTFSIIIWKNGLRNFSYQPHKELDGKYIIVTGKVVLDKQGIPSITVSNQEQIQFWDE
jgi:endonuclease G